MGEKIESKRGGRVGGGVKGRAGGVKRGGQRSSCRSLGNPGASPSNVMQHLALNLQPDLLHGLLGKKTTSVLPVAEERRVYSPSVNTSRFLLVAVCKTRCCWCSDLDARCALA